MVKNKLFELKLRNIVRKSLTQAYNGHVSQTIYIYLYK